MAKTYRPYVPEQDLLLPPSLRDWLPEGHLAYFVSDLVDQLDLSGITSVYEDEDRGYPPYHPVMLTKVLLYAYCVGVFSSRKIQRRLAEDVAFRVLAAGNEPDFRTIADFRKRHLPVLQGFFEQVLRLARELGAPRVGRVALDGSKVKANASKHKAMSYDRMGTKTRQLRDEVRQLLAQAEATDTAEDATYGADQRGDELPAELQRRESRLTADSRGETRAGGACQGRGRRHGAARRVGEARPESAIQLHRPRVADHEGARRLRAGLQRAGRGRRAATDRRSVGDAGDERQEAAAADDHHHRAAVGRHADAAARDAGYCSDANLTAIADTTIDAYISTRKQKHGERPGPCPRGPLPTTATIIDRMSRKLLTKTGAAVYAARKGIVEPVIGQIKQARGFRQFLLRGFEKVQGRMVAGVHDAQHAEAVSPVRLIGRARHSSGASRAPRPSSLAMSEDGKGSPTDIPGAPQEDM